MANNLYVNRVDYGNTTLIDISDTTATASDVASGKTFYLASGQQAIGTASGGGGSRLPSGYTELEYIGSENDAWLLTDYTPTSTTRVECEFRLRRASNGTNKVLFGVDGQFSFRRYTNDYFRTNGSNAQDFSIQARNLQKHYVYKVPTGTILDGESKATNAATVSAPLCIFAYNSGNSITNPIYADIFKFKIYEGNTLVRDYVPAKNSNGVAGFYELVNNVFYTSSSGVAFVAGTEI